MVKKQSCFIDKDVAIVELCENLEIQNLSNQFDHLATTN